MKLQGHLVSGNITFPAILFCLLLPVPALANGAMSLALATFAWTPWLVYVAVTVLYEAAAMGRWLGIPFRSALRCSLRANFVTAILGGFFSGFVSYSFLGIFGSELCPNPFGQTVFVFMLFGIGSALIEAVIWPRAGSRQSVSARPRNRYVGSLMVHLVGVPVGLAILLLPARPYVGLEMQANAQRHFWLGRRVQSLLGLYIAEHQAVPPAHNYGEMLEALRPTLGRYAKDPNLWAAAYAANYHRFDTGEMRREPLIEWNAAASGRKLFSDTERTHDVSDPDIWLIRWGNIHGVSGYVLDLSSGNLTRTNDAKKLGYPGPSPPIP